MNIQVTFTEVAVDTLCGCHQTKIVAADWKCSVAVIWESERYPEETIPSICSDEMVCSDCAREILASIGKHDHSTTFFLPNELKPADAERGGK